MGRADPQEQLQLDEQDNSVSRQREVGPQGEAGGLLNPLGPHGQAQDTAAIDGSARAQEADVRQHQAWLDAQARFSELYVKMIVSLAGGGLAVSITFVDKLVSDGPTTAAALLYVGWVCLVVALLTILANVKFALGAIEGALDDWHGVRHRARALSSIHSIDRLDFVSLAFVVLGALSLAAFAGANATGGQHGKNTTTTTNPNP